jgi:hypothetical protein
MNDILRLVEQHVRESRAELVHIEHARDRLVQHLDEMGRLLQHLDEIDRQHAAAPLARAGQDRGLMGRLRAVGLQVEQTLGAVFTK